MPPKTTDYLADYLGRCARCHKALDGPHVQSRTYCDTCQDICRKCDEPRVTRTYCREHANEEERARAVLRKYCTYHQDPAHRVTPEERQARIIAEAAA